MLTEEDFNNEGGINTDMHSCLMIFSSNKFCTHDNYAKGKGHLPGGK